MAYVTIYENKFAYVKKKQYLCSAKVMRLILLVGKDNVKKR